MAPAELAAVEGPHSAPAPSAPARTLGRTLDSIPPEAGAVAMATGIVSVAFAGYGPHTISTVLLALTAMAWATVGFAAARRCLLDRPRFRHEFASPAALTLVAATAVLGTGLSINGGAAPAAILLALALILWAVLAGPIVRGLGSSVPGTAFMCTVAAEAIAVLAGTIGARANASWLLSFALVPLAVGLALYPLVLSRFDPRRVLRDRGDHWVAGGAVAIATLATAVIARAAEAGVAFAPAERLLTDVSLGLWILTSAWLVALVAAEALRPRHEYGVERWSTVFPLGMYAVASLATGHVAGAMAIVTIGHVGSWIALAAWIAVGAGSIAARLRR